MTGIVENSARFKSQSAQSSRYMSQGGRIGLLLVGLLILYGSLFPFDFSAPGPLASELRRLIASWRLFSSRGDVLGNIGLFVPFGVLAAIAARASATQLRAMAGYLVVSVALATLCQVGQLYVPRRTPAMSDAVWNTAGTVLGLAIGWRLASIRPLENLISRLVWPAVAIALWLFAQLAPFVPSLSLSALLDNGRGLLALRFDAVEFLLAACGMVVAGVLLEGAIGSEWTRRALAAMTMIVVAGKLLIVSAGLTVATCAGLLAGYWVWALVSNCWRANATAIALQCLLLTITVRSLSPFVFRADPGEWYWLPFAHWLQGSMLSNVRSLATSFFLYGALLFIIAFHSRHVLTSSLMLAMWVLLLEVAQLWIEGRSGDITEPLLVLLAGTALKTMTPMIPQPGAASAAEADAGTRRPTAYPPWLFPLVGLAVISAAIAWSLGLLLSLPGIPYNVRELFLDHASFLPRLVFALFVLWTGMGAVLAARFVSGHRSPLLTWPAAILATSAVSLALLSASVTQESVADIAGSTNVFWFVVNRDMWGSFAREVFLWIGQPAAINLFERITRYAALYGPLIVFLCIAWLTTAQWPAQRPSRCMLILIAVSAILWLWLCKAIAFDWSSTDNLNELIARDGEWGMGGGGYLYLLLFLICLNAALIAGQHWAAPGIAAWAIMTTFLVLPIGWLLINLGLEANVRKYGQVFSGVQFLLGPDRSHKLPQEILFVRWGLVQIATTLALAAGLRIGQGLLCSIAARRANRITPVSTGAA